MMIKLSEVERRIITTLHKIFLEKDECNYIFLKKRQAIRETSSWCIIYHLPEKDLFGKYSILLLPRRDSDSLKDNKSSLKRNTRQHRLRFEI